MSRRLAVGDVVFVLDDTKRKQFWHLGRTVELFPGRDGKRCVAKAKLSTSTLLRPIQRLVPLEVYSQDVASGPADAAQPAIVQQQPASVRSALVQPPSPQQEMARYGRVVRARIVFDLCELLYGGEKPFGGENVTNHQFSSGNGLLAYDIVFVAMLYLDSAVLLMFAAWRSLFALCVCFPEYSVMSCFTCICFDYTCTLFLHAINSWCY